ncbi:extracellular solute-binding protein [Mesorhizobium sp. B1-1-6]|nr:extracellular solute-binding protein [Mesorhizobium sp. B1-1-6]
MLFLVMALMVPEEVTIIPNFFLIRAMGLIDTHWPLILLPVFGPQGVVATFLMRQFFLALPRELEEAGKMDGLSRFGGLVEDRPAHGAAGARRGCDHHLSAFVEPAKKVTEANPGKWGFEFKDGEGYASRMTHALLPPVRAYGGDLWANGQCGLDKPEAVAAIKQLHDMVFKDKSIVPPGEQGDYFSGNSAMTVNQISRASKMPEAGFKWGIAPLPSGPAGEAPVIGQAALTVFASGKNKELAAQLVADMTSKDNVAVMAQFFPPARKSVLESDAAT